MRSAFGAGSLDGAALESVELGAVELGAALESLDDGVLLDGVLDIDGDGDELCGVVLGSVVVAPGAAADGFACSVAGAACAGGVCVCSLAGAPCAEGVELSVVWA